MVVYISKYVGIPLHISNVFIVQAIITVKFIKA